MGYELYIYSCKKCRDVERSLDDRNIPYEEFNIKSKFGRERFSVLVKFLGEYLYHPDEKSKKRMMDFPILIKRSNSELKLMAQGDRIMHMIL